MEKLKNIPSLRFPEFEGEWEERKLGQVTNYVDYRGRAPIKTESGNFLVTAKNIKKGFIDYECSKEYVAESNYSNVMSKGMPKIGDVLFTTEAPMGNVAMVNKENIALAQRVIKFRGHEFINNSYLLHYMLSDVFQKNITKKSIGTTVQGISGKELHQIKFSHPSIDEQTKIASFLTAVDEKLQALKQKKTLLAQYKKGVMQKIFSQELRFKDDNGNDYPDWEEKNGDLIFESISDKKHTSDLPILAITQEFGAIPRDLIDYSVSVSDKSVESYKVVQIGDFIISLRSFQGGIEYSNYHGICSPAYIILRPHIQINSLFFKAYFKTSKYIKELQKNLEGIRDGKMISFKYFSDIKLPLPSLEEQTKIANFLSAIDEKISHCGVQVEKTEVWKKVLLQQMFC
jgi:type I restriction enzyme S subunit